MTFKLTLLVCLAAILGGCQSPFPRSDYEKPDDIKHVASHQEQRRLAFDGGFIALKRGEPYVTYPYWRWDVPNVNVGMYICNLAPHYRLSKSVAYWDEDEQVFKKWVDETGTYIESALADLGYDIKKTRESYFKDQAARPSAELLLAMKITDIKFNLCYAHSAFLGQYMDRSAGNGEVTVEWEIWDSIREVLLGSYTTKGYAEVDDLVQAGDKAVFVKAVRDAATNLGRSQWFYDIMTTMNPIDLLPATQFEKLVISNAEKMYYKPIQDRYAIARRAIISVRSEGEKYNAGFFINSTGFALTSAQTVGDAKRVQIMDVNGTKYQAKVLRVDHRRGVALIQADITNNRALPIASDDYAEMLTDVYAIGTPFGNSYRATITKGIISNHRYSVFQGIGYIQASIPTAPGYSGGPLIDEYGNVIGITADMSPNRQESTFSRFIPIHDALKALNIELETDSFK